MARSNNKNAPIPNLLSMVSWNLPSDLINNYRVISLV